MKSFTDMQYHPASEKLVQILCDKTQNTSPLFFRVLVAYYFSVVAAQMRCMIATKDRGDIPVNMYALNLSPSGTGKGYSTGIIEKSVLKHFRERFIHETFPLLADRNLPKLANKRANRKGTDPDEELEKVCKEFDGLGELLFSFNSGTSPAVKQMRHKLLMADAGSVNLEIDEIGCNLMSNSEVLETFLELYDQGEVKSKLIKNSAENKRSEEIRGNTPTNMMLFGTPSRLFDGAQVEQSLLSFMDTGYSRRCFFGYLKGATKDFNLTSEQIFELHTNKDANEYLEELAEKLCNLADIINVNKKLVMSKETSLELIDYRLHCERTAELLPDHAEMQKAEMSHRYFKVLKLAGAYAFIDDSAELTIEHLHYAMKLAEDSGAAFELMLTRDRAYVKLAKYLAAVRKEVTQADLVEDLPFYKGGVAQKSEMLTLATAYGYKNNIIIKKSFTDGIEFLRGESLNPIDLDKLRIAYSSDYTTDYQNEFAPFDQLHKLTQAPGLHWVSHHLTGGYRNEENCIAGFGLVVIDVDGGIQMSTAQLLLKDYKFLMYTTKRSTEDNNRFRIVMPMNYELALDAKDFKEFMDNIYEWLPFSVDAETNQRSRKWMSNNGTYAYNEGELLDALPFIPKTSKNEARKEQFKSQQSLDNLERWVINNTGDGNRNNQLLKFAYVLVDAGFDFDGILSRVTDLNDKLPDKLEEAEIMGTIMVTVGKALSKR
jgi:hypothetical protein